MPYADIRGVRLHYEDLGDGPPLLLLPGALEPGSRISRHSWKGCRSADCG